MKKFEKIKKRTNSFLYNHLWLKFVVEYGFSVIATLVSAAIFAFSLNVFLQPNVLGGGASGLSSLVSGGASGAAQVINLIFEICGVTIPNNPSLLFSIFYLIINIPLLYVAFRFVGKRFAILSILNVVAVFAFTNLLGGDIFIDIAVYVSEHGGTLARALFAGLCTGISSAIAYKIDSSAGGIDIVSYYFSQRKSTLTGKYSVIINSFVVASYTLITGYNSGEWGATMASMFFTFVYLLTIMLVVDVINVRNKKAQIQIITEKKDLHKLLLANIPHGATYLPARGAFTDSERYIVYMVVSTTEVKSVIKVVKQLDPKSFVNVTSLQQVYGSFHMRPIK